MPPQKPIERAKANFNQGNELQEQGMVAESIESYQKALQIKPDAQAIYRLIGDILLTQGKEAEALQCYRKALES